MWDVQTLTGLLMLWIGKASQVTLFTFKDLWYLGRRSNRSPLLYRLLKPNTTLWLMHLRRHFDFVHSSPSWNFLFLARFPSSVITKRLVHYLIHLQFLPGQNILTSGTISSVIMYRPVLFLLPGYLLRICHRIFLRNPYPFPFSLATVMFLVSQFHLLLFNFSFFLFLSFLFPFLSVMMGVCWPIRYIQNVDHGHVATRPLYKHTASPRYLLSCLLSSWHWGRMSILFILCLSCN